MLWIIILLLLLSLTGCASMLGQPSITADEFIALLQAQGADGRALLETINGSVCLAGNVTYVGAARFALTVGHPTPEAQRYCFGGFP